MKLPIFPFIYRRFISSSAPPETIVAGMAKPRIFSNNYKRNSENENSAAPAFQKLITRLVNMRVVKNMTKNGKIARFSAIVVAGTGNGGLGCGHAKHDSASEAVTKAGKLAVRDVLFFNRWQDRTLFHDDFAKYKATKLYVRPAPPSKI